MQRNVAEGCDKLRTTMGWQFGLFLLFHFYVASADSLAAPTPPMGWRSWNFFKGNINDNIMRSQADALTRKRDGVSLLDLGYNRAGMDDGWQQCDSYRVFPSNSSAFHDASGRPIVNQSKFPDLAALSAYIKSKGLLPGFYINNCICHESGGHIRNTTWRQLTYHGDVAQLVRDDFSGVKIDNCGLHNDMDEYARLIAATGRSLMVERADQGHGTPTNLTWCPYSMFRSSGDIRPSWGSIWHNLHTVLKYTNISRPDCWAYPDMLQVGNFRSSPLAKAETRTHFGAWCIVSSPLILGFDLSNQTTMAEVWPVISNREAIGINQAWAGDPGRLLNPSGTQSYPWLKTNGTNLVEVWSKVLPSSSRARARALLIVNTGTRGGVDVSVDLNEALGITCAPCSLRDIWARSGLDPVQSGEWNVGSIGPHDSVFVKVTY